MLQHRHHVMGRFACALLAATPLMMQASAHDGDHGPMTGSTVAGGQARLDYLEHLAIERPDDVGLLSRIAQARLGLARRAGTHDSYEAAESAYRQWCGLVPTRAASHVGLGYALLGQHEFQDALKAARQAARLSPEDPSAWALLGDVHFALGNVVEAEFAYRSLEEMDITMQSLSRMALVHQELGRNRKARIAFEEAIQAAELLEETPVDIAWCHTLLGDLDLEEGLHEAAQHQYVLALKLDPDARQAIMGLARVEMEQQNLARAHLLLKGLVEHHPGPRIWIALGDVLQRMNSTTEAQACFERAAEPIRSEVAAGELGHLRDLAEAELRLGHLDAAWIAAQRDLAEVRQDSGAFEILERVRRARETE